MEVALGTGLVHVGYSTRTQMVYLSANGEVLGQFGEHELPSALAAGKVPSGSFFWREGMPEWRPLRELVLPPQPPPANPSSEPAADSSSPTAAPATGVASSLAQPLKSAIARKALFVPRSGAPAAEAKTTPPQDGPEIATGPGETPSAPARPVRKIFLAQAKAAPSPITVAPASGKEMVTPAPAARRTPLPSARQEIPAAMPVARFAANPPSEPVAQPAFARSAPAPASQVMLAAAKARGRGGRKGLLLAALLMLLAALGTAVWWFFPQQPPSLEGQVRLPAADGTAAPVSGAGVFLVSRDELAARWREGLAEAQSRSAEVEELLKQATSVHREKILASELAARTSELADEYNMPDAAELREARDASQAEEAAALAELEKLTREKQSLASAAAFLQAPADALDQTRTDESGLFRLTLPESTNGLVVFVLSGSEGADNPDMRGWLVPLGGEGERRAPVVLTSENALDAGQIGEIAGVQP